MNIEILAFIVIPIIAWCLIIHTLLYRDRERVYAIWADLHSLLKQRIQVAMQFTEENQDTDTIKACLTDIDNNAYLPTLYSKHETLTQLLQTQAGTSATTQKLATLNKSIAEHTRLYNAASKNLNIRLQSFPDTIIAMLFGFKPVEYFAEKTQITSDSPML